MEELICVLFTVDFRRPKLVSAMMELKNKDIQSFSEGNMNQYHSSPIPRAILMNTAKIVPRFINRLVVHEQNATSGIYFDSIGANCDVYEASQKVSKLLWRS
jgi:hypothetical protein